MNDHLRLDWPRRYKSHLLRKLWPPYKPGQPLSQAEMRSIWALIQQDEFINQAVLQQSRVVPKVWSFLNFEKLFFVQDDQRLRACLSLGIFDPVPDEAVLLELEGEDFGAFDGHT